MNTISKVHTRQIQTNSRKGKDPSAQRSILSNVTEPEDNLLVFFIKQNRSRSLRQAFATQGAKAEVKVREKEKEEVIMTQMASASL